MKIGRTWICGLLLLLSACSRSPMMNIKSFDALDVGMSWDIVRQKVGEPVERRPLEEGEEGDFEAIYMQREGEGINRAWRYTLKFEKGVLCSKDMELVEHYGPNF